MGNCTVARSSVFAVAMEPSETRKLVASIGFSRRTAKKLHLWSTVRSLDVLLGELRPIPHQSVSKTKQVISLEGLLCANGAAEGLEKQDACVQTGDDLLVAPLCQIITRSVQERIGELSEQWRRRQEQQQIQLEDLQSQVLQLQQARPGSYGSDNSGPMNGSGVFGDPSPTIEFEMRDITTGTELVLDDLTVAAPSEQLPGAVAGAKRKVGVSESIVQSPGTDHMLKQQRRQRRCQQLAAAVCNLGAAEGV